MTLSWTYCVTWTRISMPGSTSERGSEDEEGEEFGRSTCKPRLGPNETTSEGSSRADRRTKHEGIREHGRELHEKTSEAASDIRKLNLVA